MILLFLRAALRDFEVIWVLFLAADFVDVLAVCFVALVFFEVDLALLAVLADALAVDVLLVVLDLIALHAEDLALVLHGSAFAAYEVPGSKPISATAMGTKVIATTRFQKNTIRLAKQKRVRDRLGQEIDCSGVGKSQTNYRLTCRI